MEIMINRQIYAMLTNNCNLSCPHCDIKSSDDGYNEEAFIDALNKAEGRIVLFGGEPTLYRDRLIKILSLNKASSISTNLTTKLDDEIISHLKKLSIGSSWNLNRFSPAEYQAWLNNLKILDENGMGCTVLITLTEDLIEHDINEFINLVKDWDKSFPSIKSIMFEQLVDTDKSNEFYIRVDDWLCEVHKLWESNNIKINNMIVDKLKNWYCDCSQTFTLHPNGEITNGCPHNTSIYVAGECLSCPDSDKCRPCRLQQYCTYPKKLAQLVKG